MVPAQGTGRNPVLEVRRQLFVDYESGALTYRVGEAVESLTTGLAKHALKATPMLGVIIAFENANGGLIRPAQPAKGTANVGSIEYVTLNDGDVVYAVINASKDAKWLADVTGTPGTTNDSDLPSCRIDVDSDGGNYGKVKETSALRTAAAKSNFVSHGLDADDATKMVVSILNSELDSANA